ncbi:hypothetical protein [Shewanella xiamenensis]|uniref:hypothetical protein n=1 Tax=Shewanella xiamenensis TaxID=332186 RepID=UPI0024A68134|nr:hypothetical protein [Shewanella xiamenensis]MDI5836025.1 hypothetical protein [Shewanella xiamenensis]MDI5839998.1 hypothetical protein [Shewanella xiamenensis]MDI5843836.1 hypothetical protein [Shewanella xiamenensis]MDI5848393.1 hypothetical protein [Shewanella xiamenensis]MDI5851836.1 hypothetical protein [Shewanella xiamenensis]
MDKVKFLSVLISIAIFASGCQPSDADFDKKVSEFKSTEIGKDLSNHKFIPPYSSFEPLLDYTSWCNSVLWAQLSQEEIAVDNAFLREEIFALAPKEIVRAISMINGLVENSGGVDVIYPYLHGDAAYLMKPSSLAIPVIKSMSNDYTESPSFKKIMRLKNSRPKRSESFQKADSLCSDADMLTGILGGESRSRPIIADVSALVRKNTLNSR